MNPVPATIIRCRPLWGRHFLSEAHDLWIRIPCLAWDLSYSCGQNMESQMPYKEWIRSRRFYSQRILLENTASCSRQEVLASLPGVLRCSGIKEDRPALAGCSAMVLVEIGTPESTLGQPDMADPTLWLMKCRKSLMYLQSYMRSLGEKNRFVLFAYRVPCCSSRS